MKNIYQILIKYKLLLSTISITNIIFLKLWIFNNVFNINNFFSIGGVDSRITILNLLLFFISILFFFSILKFLNDRNFLLYKNIFYFTLLILALNSIRASITIDYFTINSYFKISILVFILLLLLLIIIKFTRYFLENSFYFIGLALFPFFIIVLSKLFFPIIFLNSYNQDNFYKDITYKDQINLINNDLSNRKIIWLLFDQYDYKIIKENINKLDNFKSLSEVSDNYINYSPNTVFTIKTIPSLMLSKNFDDFEYDIDSGKIVLNVFNKSLNLKQKFEQENSIFEYLNKKNFNIYINGWYMPYCDIFRNSIYKCFQTSYAHSITFDYYGLKDYFFFQLYNIIPGANFFINKFRIKKFYHISRAGSGFEVAKKNFVSSKKSFISNLRNKNINFYFLHSNIPHAPYIFDAYTNRLIEFESRNKSNYLSNLILADRFLGDIIDELQKLNIYEESIIILQGDTGFDEMYKNLSPEEMIGSTPLLIKKSKQQKKTKIDKKINSHELASYLKIIINN